MKLRPDLSQTPPTAIMSDIDDELLALAGGDVSSGEEEVTTVIDFGPPPTQTPERNQPYPGVDFPSPDQRQERLHAIRQQWGGQAAIAQRAAMQQPAAMQQRQQQKETPTTQRTAQQLEAAVGDASKLPQVAYADGQPITLLQNGTPQWRQSAPTNQIPMPGPPNATSTYGKMRGGVATTAGASSALSPDSDLVQSMLEYIHSLEAQLRITKTDLDSCSPSAINIQVFYCLGDRDDPDTYLAEPKWEVPGDQVMLRGCLPVHDSDGYIEKKGNITFAVYKHYTIEHQKFEVEHAIQANEPLPNPEPAYQDVKLISGEMAEAMRAFIAQHPTFHTEFPELDERALKRTIKSPYIWWYHYRTKHEIQDLPPKQADLVTALTDWIEVSFGPLYDRIDHQFHRGRVSNESMEYLVRPGQVLVTEDDGNGLPMGCLAMTRPKRSSVRLMNASGMDTEEEWSWDIVVRSYTYAGEFFQKTQTVTLGLASDTWDGEVDIASLKAVPLQYVGDEIKEALERRGKTFWKCRSKRLVSYEATPNSKDKNHAVRGILVLRGERNS